jgi:predicted nicotinamide N-methyase
VPEEGDGDCETFELRLSSREAAPRVLTLRGPTHAEQEGIDGGEALAGTDEAHYGWTGARVWDSAFVLAHLADQRPAGWWVSRRVLELGCGCGAAGLATAALGARVVLTDLVPDLARHNAAANFPEGSRPVVEQLAWGDGPGLERVAAHGPFDVVLAADVLYNTYCWPALADTIRRLSGPQTEVLLASTRRSSVGDDAFFAAAAAGAPMAAAGGVVPYRPPPPARLDDCGRPLGRLWARVEELPAALATVLSSEAWRLQLAGAASPGLELRRLCVVGGVPRL